MKKTAFFSDLYRRQRGSVMGTLMVGIGLAGALSVATYQILSGPLAGISKVNQVNMTQTQLMTVARIAVMDAATMTGAGDCDADGFVEPRAARTGTGPTNGGLLPLGMGAPLTDPWGREFGYCSWDVGPLTAQAGCGGATGRIDGADKPLAGDSKTTTVLAVVSAGPDGTFSTTCNAWNAATDVIATSGDDIVYRLSYQEAAGATASTWALKSGDATTAEIAKDLQVGTGANEISFDAAGGFISALAVNNSGKVTATGGMELGDETTATTCNATTNVGVLRYNSVSKTVEICKGAAGWGELTGAAAATGMIGMDIAGVCDGTKIGYIKYVTGTATPWYYCNGSAWRVLTRQNQATGCTIGAAVGTGYCAGTINGEDIIVARRGCITAAAVAGDCVQANDRLARWAAGTSAHGTKAQGIYDGPVASATALANSVDSNSVFGYCDSLTLDGKKWSVPSVAELELIYLNHMRGLLSTANLHATAAGTNEYWTAAGYGNNQTRAVVVGFSPEIGGRVSFDQQTANNYTRCIYKRASATTAGCSGPPECPDIGDECGSGGPVFAGCHPDLQHQMFVSRCSTGQTAGANLACTGAPTGYFWADDGNIANLKASNESGIRQGSANTTQLTNGIVGGSGDSKTTAGLQTHQAAQYCADLVQDGYSDWYLPSISELVLAMNTLADGGFFANFGANSYWSSTETTGNPAQQSMIGTSSGTTFLSSTGAKNTAVGVRCMRSQSSGGLGFCAEDEKSRCILGSPRSNSDSHFVAANIRLGVNILGVTGTMPSCVNDSAVDCILNSTRVTSDANYLPQNIAYGANILGVIGTMQVEEPFTWSISSGYEHNCLARGRMSTGSQLSCWGEGGSNRLGNNGTSDQILPIPVHTHAGSSGWSDWDHVSAGQTHTCGMRYYPGSNKRIALCWGLNTAGRLGDNSTTTRARPVVVCGNAACSYPATLTALNTAITAGTIYANWEKMVAGTVRTCGIRGDNSLWCWGDGTNGRIGDGTSGTNRLIPTQVVDNSGGATYWTDWVNVALGEVHTCGIRQNGTAWCWGLAADGQLGNNNIVTTQPRPVQVLSDVGGAGWTDWVEISADAYHSCGRRSNGTLWCWGRNTDGQLGDASTTQRNLPVQVQTDTGPGGWTDWTKLSCGAVSCCGIRNAGELWCWGGFDFGGLGGDQVADATRPVRVRDAINCTPVAGTTFFNDWLDVDVGQYQACGVRSNGTVWCWGRHASGQLGWGGAAGVSSGLCITQVVGM